MLELASLNLNIYRIPNNTIWFFSLVGNIFSSQDLNVWYVWNWSKLIFAIMQTSKLEILIVITCQVAYSITKIDPSLLEKYAEKVKWIVGWICFPFLFGNVFFFTAKRKRKKKK